MSTFSNEQPSGPLAKVRPLTSTTKDGKRYKRSEAVEAEIARYLGLHESDWVAAAPDLQNETLVYLIRQIYQGNKEIFGLLVGELITRLVRMIGTWSRGFDTVPAGEISWKVEEEILKLVQAE